MVGSSSALTAVPLVTSPSSSCGVVALEVGLAPRLGSTATTTPNWRGVGEARTSRTASTMSLGTAYQSRSSSSMTCTAASLMASSPVEAGPL